MPEERIRPPDLDTANNYQRASDLRAEGDQAMAEGLDAVTKLEAEVLNEGSVFMQYVRETRAMAITAAGSITQIEPTNATAVMKIQAKIRHYQHLLEFSAKMYQVVDSEEPEGDMEDMDRLEDTND
jgi:hypothetical protein